MAKVPESGSVKTRLQPIFTPDQSKSLATCFLNDAESKVQNLKCESIIAFSPENKKKELDRILQYEHTVIEQSGGNLGTRMLSAFEFAFEQGLDSAVIIGTDSPTLPARNIERAFEYLEDGHDGVIGGTEDGGFYLIGLRFIPTGIFESVNWSTQHAFDQVLRNVNKTKVSLKRLVPWYDVDLPADIERLRNELADNPLLAPATSEWLKKN